MNKYGLEYEFFDAVDGNLLTYDYVSKCRARSDGWYHQDWGKAHSMKPGEIGVALSHLGIYKKIIEEQIEWAVILEDDVVFDQRLKNILKHQKGIDRLMKKFDLVLLGYCGNDNNFNLPAVCSYWSKYKISKSFKIGVPVKWYWSAIGYFISKRGAELLNEKQGEYPILTADILTANSPAYAVKLGVLTSPIIWPGDLNKYSTIQGDGNTLTEIIVSDKNENRKANKSLKLIYNSMKNYLLIQKLKLSIKPYRFTSSKY